jgi:hypothetical protein
MVEESTWRGLSIGVGNSLGVGLGCSMGVGDLLGVLDFILADGVGGEASADELGSVLLDSIHDVFLRERPLKSCNTMHAYISKIIKRGHSRGHKP